jgi:hypothetical protein
MVKIEPLCFSCLSFLYVFFSLGMAERPERPESMLLSLFGHGGKAGKAAKSFLAFITGQFRAISGSPRNALWAFRRWMLLVPAANPLCTDSRARFGFGRHYGCGLAHGGEYPRAKLPCIVLPPATARYGGRRRGFSVRPI